MFKAKHWGNATGNCDYFNSCSNEVWPSFGMPQNRMGNQSALNGDAYANVGCYSTHLVDAREYLWQELPQVLRGGQRYTLKFSVNLPDSLNFAINSIAGLLTKDDTRYWEKADFFDAVPQVESNPDSLLGDKEDWMPVSGSFVAEGGERYLTIGTFKRDADLWSDRVSDNLNWDEAGYYIDVVELYEDNSIGIEESPLVSSNVYPNPTTTGWVRLEYSLKTGSDVHMYLTDMSGRRVRDMTLHALHAQQDIDVRMLSSGMYVMSLVVDGRRVLSEQVVVQ